MGITVNENMKYQDFGRTRFRYFSAQDNRFPGNANAQRIVVKLEQRTPSLSTVKGSTVLTGDSVAATWRYGILKDYATGDVSCVILLAGHYGSITFFDDYAHEEHYYTRQMKAMAPATTFVSEGKNPYGHPDNKALELYKKYLGGSDKRNKVYRTDQ